jgi:hypothetical protein
MQKAATLIESQHSLEIQFWPLDRLIPYARKPRKNDAAVDRMCGSIREFGLKIPCSRAATAKWWTATYA